MHALRQVPRDRLDRQSQQQLTSANAHLAVLRTYNTTVQNELRRIASLVQPDDFCAAVGKIAASDARIDPTSRQASRVAINTANARVAELRRHNAAVRTKLGTILALKQHSQVDAALRQVPRDRLDRQSQQQLASANAHLTALQTYNTTAQTELACISTLANPDDVRIALAAVLDDGRFDETTRSARARAVEHLEQLSEHNAEIETRLEAMLSMMLHTDVDAALAAVPRSKLDQQSRGKIAEVERHMAALRVHNASSQSELARIVMINSPQEVYDVMKKIVEDARLDTASRTALALAKAHEAQLRSYNASLRVELDTIAHLNDMTGMCSRIEAYRETLARDKADPDNHALEREVMRCYNVVVRSETELGGITLVRDPGTVQTIMSRVVDDAKLDADSQTALAKARSHALAVRSSSLLHHALTTTVRDPGQIDALIQDAEKLRAEAGEAVVADLDEELERSLHDAKRRFVQAKLQAQALDDRDIHTLEQCIQLAQPANTGLLEPLGSSEDYDRACVELPQILRETLMLCCTSLWPADPAISEAIINAVMVNLGCAHLIDLESITVDDLLEVGVKRLQARRVAPELKKLLARPTATSVMDGPVQLLAGASMTDMWADRFPPPSQVDQADWTALRDTLWQFGRPYKATEDRRKALYRCALACNMMQNYILPSLALYRRWPGQATHRASPGVPAGPRSADRVIKKAPLHG